MSDRVCVAWFDREESIVAATAAARGEGYRVYDAYTPYAVHGMDEAMGLQPSRLRWVCLGGALFGLVFGVLFQMWTSSVSWPLNIGGKPTFALPSFVPVSFELMMLVAGLSTVAALLVRTRLFPRPKPRFILPRVTDDRFALVLVSAGTFNDAENKAFCRRMNALAVEFMEVDV